MEFPADYFDAITSRRHPVRVSVGERVTIGGEGFAFELERRQLKVLPRLGRTPVRIALPDGGLLVARDFDVVDYALGVDPSRQLAHRLESHPGFVVVALAAIVVAAWFAYRDGIPWAARQVAAHIPHEVEIELSEETLQAMDRFALRPSRLDPARARSIAAGFASLRQASGLPARTRLEFRDGGFVGPNALALPGGVVIITDQLVELMDDSQVIAVLAHELGHVEGRHSTRHLLSQSLHAFLAMAVMGDSSAVAGVAAGFPTVMLATAYSRDFEREADAYALALLRRAGLPPQDFAVALDKLRRAARPERDLGYLATHPNIGERIEAAEDATGCIGLSCKMESNPGKRN